ncbi:MAG: OOP family OmpA-OmpF porin [Parvicellaceae bacterium]|jgi:OOP family OmpA-OmpF porin
MKRLLIAALTLSLSVCTNFSTAQDDKNLVTNPSFESIKGKLKKQKQIAVATNWESPTGLAADLFSTGVKDVVGAPKNIYGSEDPLDGDHYAGIVAFSYNGKEPRTYIQTELLGALKKGTQYCVKFQVSLADKCKYSANNLGAYVTKRRFEVEGKSDIIFDDEKELKKVVLHPENNTFDGRFNWETVCNVFTAEGKEQFLLIGNFHNTRATTFKKLKKPKDLMGQQIPVAYYYIDQVEVFVLDSIEECDCVKKLTNTDRVLYHKQVTAEGGMTTEQQIKYSGIYFDYVKKDIDLAMKADLDHLAELMLDSVNLGIKLEIIGHIGDEEFTESRTNTYLEGLDIRRAESVKAYLVGTGIAEDRLTASGKGKEGLANEGTEEYQRAQNRRVEFKVK